MPASSPIVGSLSTKTPFFKDLIADIARGEIKIPQFQRRFVWKSQQALDLLDSIVNSYPIGSLLLWKTTDKLATERNVGDFQLPATDDLSPTSYVLDGQQRLTVIYASLAESANPGSFSASYDLRGQSFIVSPLVQVPYIFNLRDLFNTTRLLNFRTALQNLEDAPDLQVRLDRLVDNLTRYQIPVVELRDLDLAAVCPIFERINSAGTRLSTFDLMVAATWSADFDLNESVDSLATAVKAKDFDDISGDTVLKVLSALNDGSTRREAILTLRMLTAADLDSLVQMAKAAILSAVDLLATEFGVHSLDFLPYEAHIVILSYLLSKRPDLKAVQRKRLRKWFWRSGLAEHYRGASDSLVTGELEDVLSYVVTGKGYPDQFGRLLTISDVRRLTFRKNNAGSLAFSLALAGARPRNLTTGGMIDTYQALSIYNRREFHHIYPEAYLKRLDPDLERNWALNICMLSAKDNKVISDDNPSVYLPSCAVELEDAAAAVFKSNLLPLPGSFDYSSRSYEEFLASRAEVVQTWLRDLCEGVETSG